MFFPLRITLSILLRKKLIIASVLVALIVFWLVIPNPGVASVNIIDFRAESHSGYVVIYWETGSEIDNAGFYIHRSLDSNLAHAVVIGDFVYSDGGAGGAAYNYTDSDVQNGTQYFYWLEILSNTGNSDYYGPRYVTPGVIYTPTPTSTFTPIAPTNTSTATATRTATATSTSNGLAATPTRTPTPTPTRTSTTIYYGYTSTRTNTPVGGLYPVVSYTPRATTSPTPGPSLTATITPEPSITTTPTLEPLPSLELLFPFITPTYTSTPTAVSSSDLAGLNTNGKSRSSVDPKMFLLGGVLILIWMLLGSFAYISVKRASHS